MEVRKLNGKVCYVTGIGEHYEKLFLWPVGRHEVKSRERVFEALSPALKEHNCLLAAFEIEDWNGELSPWEAPAVFGKEDFAGRGRETLQWLVQDCISHFQSECPDNAKELKLFIGGYSLAGLFALWAFHETSLFHGAASCSGSLWFPGFTGYIKEKNVLEANVLEALKTHEKERTFLYFSLGVQEAKSKNPVLSTIRDCTEEVYAYYNGREDIRAVLEWNPGGHFTDPEGRLKKGFSSLLQMQA